MTRILAIDPGNTQSAYALIHQATKRPLDFGKVPNRDLIRILANTLHLGQPHTRVAIEMVASYGMPVGADVFETCVWIGRFAHHCESYVATVDLVKRNPVKVHHCHSSKAKDSNVTQALVDRFTPGQPNHGKGTKANPGWFHGFAKDVWQAYALAVYVADTTPVASPSTPPSPAAGEAPTAPRRGRTVERVTTTEGLLS